MKNKDEIVMCPLCESGEFTPFSDGVHSFRHGKKKHEVKGLQYARCSNCETTGYLPGQRKFNAELISKYQAKIPEYISPSDVLAVRERYSLTQKEASKIFKGGPNGFSKWERGIAFPSGPTAMLIKVALSSIEAMRELAKIADVDIPIVDSKFAAKEVVHQPVDQPSVLNVIVQCTHAEYVDDYVERNDVGFDSEKIGIWTAENQPTNISSLN